MSGRSRAWRLGLSSVITMMLLAALLAFGSGPASAAPGRVKGEVDVRCEPDPVQEGGTWTISGGSLADGVGFQPNTEVEILIGHDISLTTMTDDDGLFSVDYEVVDLVPGEWGITAGSLGAVGTTTCVVAEAEEPVPSISIEPMNGERGSAATVSGRNFDRGESVTLTLGDHELASGVMVADDGTFTHDVTIPDEPDGDYPVTATRGVEPEPEAATFAISGPNPPPTITVDPAIGQRGTTVTITGAGYQPDDKVTITFDGQPFATAEAADDGSFSVEGTVPTDPDGDYPVAASRGREPEAEAQAFTIEGPPIDEPVPSIGIDPATGERGSTAIVTGADYQPGDLVTLTLGGIEVASGVEVNPDGTFSQEIVVPDEADGDHVVEAARGTDPEAPAVSFAINGPAGDCFRILGLCWWWWIVILGLLLLILWLLCRFRYPFEEGETIRGTTWVAGAGTCKLRDGRCIPDGAEGGCGEDHSCQLFRRKMFRSKGCWEHVERKQQRFFWCYRCACARPANGIES